MSIVTFFIRTTLSRLHSSNMQNRSIRDAHQDTEGD